MTVKDNAVLKERQKSLISNYLALERVQTDFSYDSDFYAYCQRRMDDLDDQAEQIRHQIEGD